MSKIDLSERNPVETRPMQAGRVPRGAKVMAALKAVAQLGYAPGLPEGDRVLITDLSHWNGPVNFAGMKAAGAAGFYQKATEGAYNWVDPTYEGRRAAAEEMGYPYGLYHFLRPVSGVAQARMFIDKTRAGRGVFPNIGDVEVAMPAWIVREYAMNIHAEFGYYPWIYTSNYCWSLVTGAEDKAWVVEHCGLHVAHWGAANPLLPPGWNTYDLHQFSANGNRRGREFGCTGEEPDVDLNWARRSWFEQYVPPEPVAAVPLDVWAGEVDVWARGLGYRGPRPGSSG